MSVSGDGGLELVSWRRLLAGGVVAFAAPFVVGIFIALGQPDHNWHVEGIFGFLAACGGLAVLAGAGAFVAGAEPIAVGAMAGVSIAIGSIVRDASALGALFAIGAGMLGGWAAWGQMPQRRAPKSAIAGLVVVALVLGTPVAVFARQSPADAADALSESPVLATVTHGSLGYVLTGRAGHFLNGGSIVRVVKTGIQSWRAETYGRVQQECRFPERTDGTDVPSLYPVRSRPAHSGVLVKRADIERACWIFSERVIAGVAPEGTARIEATDERGHVRAIPMGAGRTYIEFIQEPAIEVKPVLARIAFKDAGGRVLDAKPPGYSLLHWDLAQASGLASGVIPEDKPIPHMVTVSVSLLTPGEYRAQCGGEPPYGEDGFLTIGIVRRDDGTTREVVIGTGSPISSEHPTPDPPIVRPSDGRPCFAKN